jgi:hypothetical protein
MSPRAVTFVRIWVKKTLPENANLSQADARQAAIHLLLDAAAIGISPIEVEEEYSDLADFIATPDQNACAGHRQ